MSERWVMSTNVELDKGGAKGGAVELWERRADGGLRFGLKVESLSCILRVGERQSVGLRFGGRRRQRKEKAESCMWWNSRAIYRVLEKFYFAFIFLFLVLEKFFFFVFIVFFVFIYFLILC